MFTPRQPDTPPSQSSTTTATTASPCPVSFPAASGSRCSRATPRADGQFFYAVKSTKIYCRPSCPSRRPARKNVTFFPTAAAAEQAGYRACKRCEPDLATPRPDPQAAAIAAATEYLTRARIRTHPPRRPGQGHRRRPPHPPAWLPPRARRLARRVRQAPSASPASKTRCAPQTAKPQRSSCTAVARRQAHHRRHLRSRLRLLQPPLRVQQRRARHDPAHHARRAAPACSSATPPRPARSAACWSPPRPPASAPSPSAATTPNSSPICASASTRPNSSPAKGNTGWLADAVAFVASQTTEHPLAATFPLDVRATAFQQRVWKALQQIPRGQTRSYSDVARELGRPTADPRRRRRHRRQPRRRRRPLPPRHRQGWQPHRLPLGHRAQTQTARRRSRSHAIDRFAHPSRWSARNLGRDHREHRSKPNTRHDSDPCIHGHKPRRRPGVCRQQPVHRAHRIHALPAHPAMARHRAAADSTTAPAVDCAQCPSSRFVQNPVHPDRIPVIPGHIPQSPESIPARARYAAPPAAALQTAAGRIAPPRR